MELNRKNYVKTRTIKSSSRRWNIDGTTITATNDDILILCTGYRPCLDFFSPNIFKQLSYTPDDLFCPIILLRNIFHLPLSNLALTGMCRNVSWMIIKLQARWVATIFAGLLPTPSIALQQTGLRIGVQPSRPQFHIVLTSELLII
jgi:hypothetical protein